MRSKSYVLVVVIFLCSSVVLLAQTSSTSPPTASNSEQAIATLQSAISALAGSAFVRDVTLTGTAERIAGSDDETAAVTYKAIPSANRLDLTLSGGTRSEIWSNGSSGPSGTWIGPDGVSHSMANHNVMTDPGWFPLFAFGNINSSSNSLVSYVGQETRNGVAVIHLSAFQQIQNSKGSATALLQHLTKVDIYMDSSTFLPVSFVFNMHADNDAGLDIPAEIRYSNFQNVGGVRIPFHIQKFVNNSLTLDLQFQNASLNTGITFAQISAQ